ncbi:hypothetical protein QBC38DRAFT_131365 [Podospora fimiseda]|uniref:3-oxoacyl-[acyl-carrier-protein] reductase n=1 Tax=Podospora fimiseda TaxID=252190 RepID=A0AAN7BSY5_9PEZI|nr:hypothetical protein QBC38DRAFT_131365 [Podospora fimiseda]
MSLLHKTTLITGSTKGIGLAIATRFAHEGSKIIMASPSSSPSHPSFLSLPSLPPSTTPSHFPFPLDVSSPQSWSHFLKSLPPSHQKIDILINCAGISHSKLLTQTTEDQILSLINTNLTGAILGCKYIGKQMILSSRNRDESTTTKCIINISSLLAKKSVLGTSVYSASKAGLLGLTTSLSKEYGAYGIRVNAILPGYIETAMTQEIPREKWTSEIPLKRFGTPEEVADAAAFLAKNQYANNCILNLDGGLSA